MSHNTALREPRQSPSPAPAQHESPMHARIRQAMPDLDDAAVERLAGICAELPPPGQPAANARDASANAQAARYYATRTGLAGLVNGGFQDHLRDLSTMDWLLLSVRMAAEDDASGDWIVALTEVGSGWIDAQRGEIRNFDPMWQAAMALVDREEGRA